MRACDHLEALVEALDTLPELAWREALAEHDDDEPAGAVADDDLLLLARLRAGPDEPRGSPP
jgi:hypothetical protein